MSTTVRGRAAHLVTALLAVLVIGIAAAPGARAHADLLLSTPEDGAVLAAVPDEVVLTFSEDLLPDTVVVSVSDETGMAVRVLSLSVDGADVVVTWPPGLTGTAYDVNFRVVSQDGHPVEGTVAFTVEQGPSGPSAAAAAPSPSAPAEAASAAASIATPAAAPAESGGSLAPLAAISAGLGIGIAAGFLFWLMRRRSGGQGTGSGS